MRNFEESINAGNVVTNRVRSASESSGLRHLFSNKKKEATVADEVDGQKSEFTGPIA